MKIKTFVTLSSIFAIGAGAISSAVVFSTDVGNDAYPYVRVLTKNAYLNLKQSQHNTANLFIDYANLPSSDISISDLVQQKDLGNLNAFIFTVGSQAYGETNQILNGVNKSFNVINPYEVSSSSIMLKLYDLFYNDQADNHEAVKDFNINFFSFLDIVNTKEIRKASDLLQYRRTQLGTLPPIENGNNQPNSGASNVWKVEDPKTKISSDLPVVKTSGGNSNQIEFNYEPAPNYYEFLPNDKFETKYEKVYFRNQDEVNLFNNVINWINDYASNYLSNINISKQGSIVAAKKVDNQWSFNTFSSSSTLEDFISFYNPEYSKDKTQNESNSNNS